MTMRHLLSQNPMTFNELLDLFEAYVSTIGGPINKGHDMLREVIGAGENTALGHIFGVACDAEDMAKRLKQLRVARNNGTDVTITLTETEHRQLDTAIPDMIGLVEDTVRALDLLSGGFETGSIDSDQPAITATLRLIGRALRGADEIEIPALMMADRKIRKAVAAGREAERQAAVHMEEAA